MDGSTCPKPRENKESGNVDMLFMTTQKKKAAEKDFSAALILLLI
jgi:hypothetical protein